MKRNLTSKQRQELLEVLRERFERNMHRHPGIKWEAVMERLKAQPEKLWSVGEMERTGGEPDVVGHNKKTGELIFMDCSPESPAGRRSLCYDHQAWASRKENKPKSSVEDMARGMGIELLSEEQYRFLQSLGAVDTKTSSWISTPATIRALGGALFGDYRYGQVFVYHNGAESYYAARGFRGMLRV
jgi:hypothetical protein